MDATQAISDSILESEEEEDNEEKIQNERRKPLAKLCILNNPHIPEKELPLFLGDNFLGRDPNLCTIQLLAPSVSKQHAAISISVYRRRGRVHEVDMEAVVWDQKSMNGTHKGRLKLTPNVRYALNEGDNLVLGDIPCRYVSSGVDSPSSLGDTEKPRQSEANARLSDWDNVDAGSKKCVSSATKAKRTPVTVGCLSFEKTPVQAQGILVPESDSESESEREGRGNRKQKDVVSASDSYKSSLSDSAFLSPPSKVIPESEDESSITPSSSSRNGSSRRFGFSLEKMDIDLEKNKSPVFVENGVEEGEGAAKGGVYSEERGHNVKSEACKSPTESSESLRSMLQVSTDSDPEFNLDSDTDVEGGEEEEEEEEVPAGKSDQRPNTVLSHMDSDTDADDDVSDKAPRTSPSTDEATKHSPVASGIQLEGITVDSDTDVDDDDDDANANVTSKATLPQGVHCADFAPTVQSEDFHLDSDTDVDEEEEVGKRGNPKTDKTLREKSDKPLSPHNLHPDSHTCDKEVTGTGLDILSESDTDLEEDSVPAVPAAAADLPVSSAADLPVSSAAAGAPEPESDADTDVDEPVAPHAADEGKPADLRMESDTDVEDEEASPGEEEQGQIPHLLRENTAEFPVVLWQNCSTPVHVSEGEVEQMETQVFTSPTSHPHRYTVSSSLRPALMSSCSDSQEDEDYAVAETQSFILQTRSCHKGLNPNRASIPKSSAVKQEDRSKRDGSFQLGLSDSSHLQGEVRENTQAYALVDGGVNMEDTQDYEESAKNDSNLEATQPYEVEPPRSSEMSKTETCVDLTMEATQAYIPEPYDEGSDEDEGLNSARTGVASSALAIAETQPMFSSVEDNEPDCSLEPVKNETERHVTDSESVAETQPVFTSDNEERGDEELSVESMKSAEEQKHPWTSSAFCLAETQPVRLSDNEESGDDEELSAESLRPSKVETHPNTDAALSLAETQPLHVSADETEPMDSCGDHENNSEILLPQKRKAKQLHIDEEDSQQRTDSGETQPLTPGEDDDDSESMPCLRKRKAKPLQLEDETQSLVGSQGSAVESQRSVTCEEEQSSQDFISTQKRKVKPLHIEDEQTQPLINCEDEDVLPERESKVLPLTSAEVQKKGRNGKRDGDESVTYPRKRKEKRLHLEEEETQLVSASESQRKTDETKVSPGTKETGEQTKTEDDNSQQEVKVVNQKTRRRTTRKQEEQEEDKNKRAENENRVKEEKGEKLRGEPEIHKREELMNEGTSKPHLEDDMQLIAASESQRRIDGTKVSPSNKETGEQKNNKDENDQQEEKVVNQQTRERRTTRKQEQDEDKNKSQLKEQGDRKLGGDETDRHENKELMNGGASKSQLEEETHPVTVSEVSPPNTVKNPDVFDAASIPGSMETQLGEEKEKAQCSSRQTRQMKTENKPLPSTRGRRGKTKSKGDDNQEEVKAANQPTRGRRSTKKQDDDERQGSDENKSQIKEEGDKEEREHVETERRSEREEKSKGKPRLKEMKSGREVEEEKGTSVETTKTDQEHLTRVEKEKQPNESQEDKNEEENPKGSARARRASRRTTTAVCEASSEDVPARRTRSRSSSLSSERSVSYINSNILENKGRGRGVKRSSEASQTHTVRSSRRRTTTATAVEPDAEAQAVSASAKVSRGRSQARGRKTLSQPDVVIKENEQKATEVLQQDEKRKADPKFAGTSRGQRRATASCSEALVLNDQEKTSADLASPLPKRNMRNRGAKTVKTEPVEETEAPTATAADETRNKRKAKTSEENLEVDRVQKSTEPGGKEEQQEEIPVGIQGRRTSRASSAQVKKNKELLCTQEVKDGKKAAAGAAGKKARCRTTVVQKNKNQELQETRTSGSSLELAGNEVESEISAITPSQKRRVSSNSSPMAMTPRSSSASPATVSRVQSRSQTYKVLFTGVVVEDGEQVLARLGGAMARGVSDMNCLVTDKVRRTVKFLCAVAKGVPVVTTQWLKESGKAGRFLSPLDFIVKDPEQEKKFSFSLQESLRTASSQPLLQGYEIHVTKSVQPELVLMKEIITCCGATFLKKMPAAHKPRAVVISCEEDLQLCGPAVSASLPVVTAEFILTGILQQRVDLQTHALSPGATNPHPAEGRGRGRKKT